MDIKERFEKLDVSEKIIVVGALIAVVSVVLPWYKDLDTFITSGVFLGISGPLYMFGIIAGVAAVTVFMTVASAMMPKLKISVYKKKSTIFAVASSVSIVLGLLALSIFFHPEFGINIASKKVGIGILMLFLGNSMILFGSFLARRRETISQDIEMKEEVIELMTEDRKAAGVNSVYDHGKMAVRNALYQDIRNRDIDHLSENEISNK